VTDSDRFLVGGRPTTLIPGDGMGKLLIAMMVLGFASAVHGQPAPPGLPAVFNRNTEAQASATCSSDNKERKPALSLDTEQVGVGRPA